MESVFCWLLVLTFVAGTTAQITCANGVIIYEKSSATSVRLDSRADRTIEIATSEVPTTNCQRVCDGTPSCTAFTVDYTARTCKVYSVPVQKSRLLSRPDSAFFEKTCIPDLQRAKFRAKCSSRLWAVERVRGMTFEGPVIRAEDNVPTREVCTRICLTETSFNCASVTYDEITRICALSSEDRHSQPTALSQKSRTTDYMENQCLSDLRDCQFLPQSSFKVVTIDHITTARSEDQCRDECTKNTAIICRSYSYELAQNACMLSSDDSISLEGVEIPREDGYRYAERRCKHDRSRFTAAQQLALMSPLAGSIFAGNGDSNFMSTDPSGTTFAFGQSMANPSSIGLRGGFNSGGFGQPNSFGFGTQQDQLNPNRLPTHFSGSGFGFNNPGNQGFLPSGGGLGQGGFQDPNNPAFFNQGQGIPGLSRFDQDGVDPRIFFNIFRRPVATSSSNTPNLAYFPPERCSFEKASGLAVIADPHSTIPANSFNRGVTAQCSTFCRLQGHTNCPAFVLDYNTNQCNMLSRPADVALAPGTIHGQSYFEQVCFSDFHRACEGKAWAFERIVGSELRGFDDRKLPNVNSRRDCEESCLKETQFVCMSAEYDSARSECRLSRESRVSRSYAFQQAPETDYLENQCVSPTTQSSCTPMRQEGLNLLYVDASVSQVFTEDECRRTCQTYANFSCQAASYRQSTHECFLSGDLTVVAQNDFILLHSSCLQPIQIATPLLNTNFGQMFPTSGAGSTIPGGFNGFNGIQTIQNPFAPGRNPNFNVQTGTSRPTNSQNPNLQPQGGQGFVDNNNLFGNEQFFPQIPGQTFAATNGGVIPNGLSFNNAGGQQFGVQRQPFGSFGQSFGVGQQFPNQFQGSTNQGTQFGLVGQPFAGTGNQFGTPDQHFVGAGTQFGGQGQQFGGQGQQFGSQGQQFGGQGQQFGGQGQQFGGQGQQFGGQGQQFGGQGQQFGGQGQLFGQQQPFGGNRQPFGATGQQSPFGVSGQQPFVQNGQQFPGGQQQQQPFNLNGQQPFVQSNQPFGSARVPFGGQQFGNPAGQQFGNAGSFASPAGQPFGSGAGGNGQFSSIDGQNFGQRNPLDGSTGFGNGGSFAGTSPLGRSTGNNSGEQRLSNSDRSRNLKRLSSSERPRSRAEQLRRSNVNVAEKLTSRPDPQRATDDLE